MSERRREVCGFEFVDAFFALFQDLYDKGKHRLGLSVYFLHSLHSERRRPCSQIDAPPHSLHLER